MNTRQLSRRALLCRAALLGAALPGLRGFGVRAGERQDGGDDGGPEDYRALVCVNLNGGVDGFSFAVPRGATEHERYRVARQDLALPRAALVPIQPTNAAGLEYGMAPQLPELARRFDAGGLAVVANVGPLVRPLTKAEYLAGSAPVPAFLFSHSDQSEQWRVARADTLGPFGWCGRLADRLAARNGDTALPLCTSVAGETKLLVGRRTSPYFMSPRGPEPILALSDPGLRADFERLLRADARHPMQARYARVAREAIEIDALLSRALADGPTFEGQFPAGSSLAEQLRTVARVIAVRRALGMRRQVFFVDQVGYDTHAGQDIYLPPLLRGVSLALDSFQSALATLGVEPLVTTFTTSEFGRTLSSNGKGTDHGWGNHHVVMGGAVVGRALHGTMPELALGSPDDIDEGRIVPTQSVEQYAATLARWFGLSDDELVSVFPGLPRFDGADLGFLRA